MLLLLRRQLQPLLGPSRIRKSLLTRRSGTRHSPVQSLRRSRSLAATSVRSHDPRPVVAFLPECLDCHRSFSPGSGRALFRSGSEPAPAPPSFIYVHVSRVRVRTLFVARRNHGRHIVGGGVVVFPPSSQRARRRKRTRQTICLSKCDASCSCC